MRLAYALLVICFLILPLGCGGESSTPKEGAGAAVEEPTAGTVEEMNELLPPPGPAKNP